MEVMIIMQKQKFTSSQKLMVFVLTMSLYGLATMFSELIPKVNVGIIEFSVEYFLFIPLTIAILLDPLSAGLGAATGELIFSEIMLGQFGGIGELEKFTTVTIGVFIAGIMVKDPLDKKQVGIAAITGTAAQLLMGTMVDVFKVIFAVEDFEAIAGLPESVWATEFFAFFNDLLFSGILFCLIPTLILVPRLYRKIEPHIGVHPRTEYPVVDGLAWKIILLVIVGIAVGFGFEYLAESGFQLIDWEADWAESQTSIIISLIVAAVLSLASIIWIKNNKERKAVQE